MATSSSRGHEHLPDSKSPHRRSNYCWLFNQFSLDIQHQISIRLLVRASQLLPWGYNRNRHWPLPIITNIHKLNTTMLKLKQKINYKGHEYQVVDIENVTQPLSVGEDEILYHLCNRHGDVIQVMDWELVNDRKGTRKLTPLILIGLLHGAIFLVYGHVVWLITSSTFFVA